MVRLHRGVSVLVALSLTLSLGVLGPPAARPLAAAEIDVNPGDSIQDAINAAAPGDTIIVNPGTYTGDLAIDKSLTLISSGGAAATTIEGGVTVQLLDEETVVLGGEGTGFTIDGTGGKTGVDATVEFWSSLSVEGNTFINCYRGVEVNALRYFSQLDIEDNIFDSTQSAGIYFAQEDNAFAYHSGANVLDNTFTSCGGAGVNGYYVVEDCHALIQGNTIYDAGWIGLYFNTIRDRSSLDLVDNEVTYSDWHGIYLESYENLSTGLISENTVTHSGGGGGGIFFGYGVEDGSQVTVSDNTITDNTGYGFHTNPVKNGSYLALLDNEVSRNYYDALYIYSLNNGSEALVQGNTVTDNDSGGVYVEDYVEYRSLITVQDNTITGNCNYGCYVDDLYSAGRAEILDNDIRNNGGGVTVYSIAYGSEGLIEGNTISDNGEESGYYGVYVYSISSGSELTLEDNDIKRNADDGFYLEYDMGYGCSLSMLDNDVSDNLDDGVYIADVYNGCECTFDGNTITGNTGDGLYIDHNSDENGSRFTVSNNTISENGIKGLYVGSVAGGAYLGVLDNTIHDNSDDGVYVSHVRYGSECTFQGNLVTSNAYGIYVDYASNGSLLEFERNEVTGNHAGGIYCGDYVTTSELKVLDNIISDNEGTGLQVARDLDNLDQSLGGSTATIRCNTISGNYAWGIYAYIYHSLVDISGNHITWNGEDEGGIYIGGDRFGLVGIHQNSIADNHDWGLENGGLDSVDATENWWGNNSGPYHATTNPGGSGNEVSDDVDYTDWLVAEPEICALYEPDVESPATITVGDGDEDYSSIKDAIDNADPGDIILVSPGTYADDLSVYGSMTIKSTGGADVTFIEGTVTLDVNTDNSTIIFGGEGAGFNIYSSYGDGIYVDVENWSQVVIQDNTINNCGEEGIFCYGVRGFSSLSIIDNEITGNNDAGFDSYSIEEFSSLDIRGNNIQSNGGDGVHLSNSDAVAYRSSLAIVDNEITDNSSDGIRMGYIKYASSGLIEGNTLNNNVARGFHVDYLEQRSSLDVADNEIRDNGEYGIYADTFTGNCEATFENNQITGNGYDGFYFYSNVEQDARLVLDGNTITDNVGAGICTSDYAGADYGGYLELTNNEVSSNGSYGMYVCHITEGSEGIISGNTMSGNGSDGLYLSEGLTYGSRLTMQDNTVTGNDGYGTDISSFYYGCYLELIDNEFSGQQGPGVHLGECQYGSEALIDGNTFSDNTGNGFYVNGDVEYGSRMTFEGNSFEDNGDDACQVNPVYYGSYLALLDNEVSLSDGFEVTEPDVCGFDLSGCYEGSEGLVRGNTVSGFPTDGVYLMEVEYGSRVTVEGNGVSNNGEQGFDCSSGIKDGAYIAFLDNTLEDNSDDGLYVYCVTGGSEAVIRGNTVSGNDNGITIDEAHTGGLLKVDDNEVSGNDSIGLWLCGAEDTLLDSEAAVLGNTVTGNGGWGIEGNIEHGLVDISGCNTVEGNSGGIHVFGSGLHTVHINGNNINGNVGWGLLNDASELLDATENWWGDVSGPQHPTSNPAGLGDLVSDLVAFEPWMTHACDPSNIAAAFSASTTAARPREAISFTDQSTTGCDIVQWLWDFGDGTTSTEQNPTHDYLRVGRYTITLTVWDACGYSDTVARSAYILVTTEKETERDRALEPPAFGLSYLRIDPEQVLPNQQVTVSVNVCNSGEEQGTRPVSLTVNGEVVDSNTVGVPGGSCQMVSFTVSRAVPGTYQVSIDGVAGQFSVLAPRIVTNTVPSTQSSGLGTAGIIAIIVMMLVLIAALVVMFRRS